MSCRGHELPRVMGGRGMNPYRSLWIYERTGDLGGDPNSILRIISSTRAILRVGGPGGRCPHFMVEQNVIVKAIVFVSLYHLPDNGTNAAQPHPTVQPGVPRSGARRGILPGIAASTRLGGYSGVRV